MSFKPAPTSPPSLPFDQTVNQETAYRTAAISALNTTSGQIRAAYFRSSRSGTYTSVMTSTTATAAGATPTLCKMGVWIVNADGSLTLIGSTPNDTTLFAASNTNYQRSLSSPVTLQAGKIYAFGSLVVTAFTPPQLIAAGLPFWAGTMTPVVGILLTGLADLPSNAVPNNNAFGSVGYGVLLP